MKSETSLIPNGFSEIKGEKNYWEDAVRDFWASTGLDTDSVDLAIIVTWFDEFRDYHKVEKHEQNHRRFPD